mmetsp:Transcript_72244/g.199231  ORF Transcript_72244/g.199231 Transcript_72244/m.199231 type:complete len:750 (+) Transcript_72244:47-2296(+)
MADDEEPDAATPELLSDPSADSQLSTPSKPITPGRQHSSGPYTRRRLRAPVIHRLDALYKEEDDEGYHIDHCGSHVVMHENNTLRLLWSCTLFIILVYTATVFLYRFSFHTFRISEDGADPLGKHQASWDGVDAVVDVFFWMDLFLNFFLSYKDRNGNEVDSMRLIAKQYLSGFFWVNLLACVPVQLVEGLIAAILDKENKQEHVVNQVARVAMLQRVPRLATLTRLTRLTKLFSFFLTNHYWKALQGFRSLRVITFICGLFWTVHLLACFWYLAAAIQDDPQETWVGRRGIDAAGTSLLNASSVEQWVTSMYFVFTVFTTVGFGDIAPISTVEIVCVAFIMTVGAIVHSIIISKVIQAVTSTDRIHEFIDKQLKTLDAFCEHTEIAPDVQKRLKGEIRWRAQGWVVHHCYDKKEITQLIMSRYMPRTIVEEMPTSLFSGKLVKNRLVTCCCWHGLNHLPPKFPLLLAAHLARVQLMAGEIVYQMNDFPFNLFLVLSGTFACVARPTPGGGIDDMYINAESTSVAATGSHLLEEMAAFRGALLSTVHAAVGASCSSRTQEPAEPQSSFYPYRLFSCHNYFGEGELPQGRPRLATVRCEREGTLLVLAKQDLLYLEDQFPQFRSAWRSAAPVRERFRRDACQRLTVGLSVRQFAALRLQRYFRSQREARCEQPQSADAIHAVVENAFVQLHEHSAIKSSLGREALAAIPRDEELHRKVDSLSEGLNALRKDLLPLLRGTDRSETASVCSF